MSSQRAITTIRYRSFAGKTAEVCSSWDVVRDGVNGVDGLNTPLSVAVHPVTQEILVAGYGDSALTAFERDRATGHPVYLGMEKDGVRGVYGLGGAYAIAVSPDGRHVYVAGTTDQALVVFGRGISRLYLPLNLHSSHN